MQTGMTAFQEKIIGFFFLTADTKVSFKSFSKNVLVNTLKNVF